MACASLGDLLSSASRKKRLSDNVEVYETPLQRSLTTSDLVLMGVGTMIGAGLYVLTGVEAKNVVGPAVVVSYTIAAIASVFSAMCYVEFACRIPRTGSAYTFTYIAVGEIWAFLIGWNLVLEYAIAAASVAKAFTGYVDSLTGHAIANFTIETFMGGKLWTVRSIAPYPDILSAVVVVLITIFVITGARVSSWTNGIFLIINMIVIAVIIVMGFTKADGNNWKDYGGFVPYGPGSVVAAAATLFFSYVGFDTVAMANEETIDPKRSVPKATFISLLITYISYVLTSAALTLMLPYTELDEKSAFAAAFDTLGIEWARWVVGVGALSAMFTTILMNLYCLPRSTYAMATDGLLFQWLGRVNEVTRVPVYGSLFSMILVVIPTVFFTLRQLIGFLSIGVLVGYTFVAASVLLLRYKTDTLGFSDVDAMEMVAPDSVSKQDLPSLKSSEGHQATSNESCSELLPAVIGSPGTLKPQFRSMPVLRELARFQPGTAVSFSLCVCVFFIFCTCAIVEHGNQYLMDGSWWAIILLVFFILCAVGSFLVIPLHIQNDSVGDYYRVSFTNSSTSECLGR